MRNLVARLLRALFKPCWCGGIHRRGVWHDPTHGDIDRDLQDTARQIHGVDPGMSVADLKARGLLGSVVATELNLQRRRNEGRP